jgi:hypothetical protein
MKVFLLMMMASAVFCQPPRDPFVRPPGALVDVTATGIVGIDVSTAPPMDRDDILVICFSSLFTMINK